MLIVPLSRSRSVYDRSIRRAGEYFIRYATCNSVEQNFCPYCAGACLDIYSTVYGKYWISASCAVHTVSQLGYFVASSDLRRYPYVLLSERGWA